ncbi:MAG: tyrosine--tRNA ligase [Treponema sp.]|nr:MAG: tyrosine--tRNA ligase [Treponema sp.]
MNETLEILKSRGFLQQCTGIDALSEKMNSGSVNFYVGIDPTGGSIHIGHMVPVFAMKHLVNAGHKGVLLLGGGTSRIGDPSGKTETRKMLDYDELDANTEKIISQLKFFISKDRADIKNVSFENNKEWLKDLNYIDFLRDIGSHFSVNRMLTFEAYKKRMETGLSFLEFNYQLLQSYDFLMLHQKYNCTLQIGGADQWGNIVAGADLIRRKTGKEVFGLTFPLLTTADGKKMGKTENGALFLDPDLVSPYEFFQYWRNVDDRDVKKYLLIFTFLGIPEIEEILAGHINTAKEKLAFEVTKIVHGKQEAEKALAGAKAAFSGGGNLDAMPTTNLEKTKFNEGLNIVELFFQAGLCGTKSDARRLVQQGGAYVNDECIKDIKANLNSSSLNVDGELILRAGKKRFMRVITE